MSLELKYAVPRLLYAGDYSAFTASTDLGIQRGAPPNKTSKEYGLKSIRVRVRVRVCV